MTNDAHDYLQKWRELGFIYSAVTPASVSPEAVDAADIDARSAEATPGYRTWLFRTQAEQREFRRMYGVSS